MPPCGICHSSPGRMISGPSSLKRRPIRTRPDALNSAIPTLPGASGNGAGNVVAQPLRHLAELLDRADAGFLIEFALRRRPGILAGIDAALRHLPDMGFVDMFDTAAGAAADKDQPRRI